MKTFYLIIKIILEIWVLYQRVALFFEATINLAPIGVLHMLGKQYIIGSDLLSSVMFRLKLLQ